MQRRILAAARVAEAGEGLFLPAVVSPGHVVLVVLR
jgi:hypothetical protein